MKPASHTERNRLRGAVAAYTRKDGTKVKAYRRASPGTTRHIFVTGVPGSGKTTESKKLAKDKGLPLLSLDSLKSETDLKFAGTAESRKALAALDKPHVVEGVQILGFGPKDLKGHELKVMKQPDKVLVDRLVRRGWYTMDGRLVRGEKKRKNTEAEVERFKKYLVGFERRRKSPNGSAVEIVHKRTPSQLEKRAAKAALRAGI